MQKTVIIIDQNADNGAALAEQVPNASLAAPDEAMDRVRSDKPQAVILNATDEALTAEIRAILPHALLIALTADGAEPASSPADICLPRPFHISELLRALQSGGEHGEGAFTIGTAVFQPRRRSLTVGEAAPSYLTDKEAMVLDYLCRHAAGFVSREDLLQQVWGYQSDMDTHTLETHIYRLRQKLMGEGARLRTEEGGYRLDTTDKESL